jgi:tripartite-type tricarboxylate transporter receptor subunit TctC
VKPSAVLATALFAVLIAAVAAVHAQPYTAKAIRIIVPLVPGGNLDIVARAIAAPMSETFGQQIIEGNAITIVDVIAGNVQMMFDQVSTAKSYVDSGKLRALGVTSLKRTPLFPTVPTIDESGLKGYEEITMNGFVAPAGTPREALTRVQSEVARIVRLPDLRKRYLDRGIELVASVSPDEFSAYIKAEFDKKARLARETGMRID